MGLPGLFLFVFVLFKHKVCRKTVGFRGIRTRIIGVEGEHADHHHGPRNSNVVNLLNLRKRWLADQFLKHFAFGVLPFSRFVIQKAFS